MDMREIRQTDSQIILVILFGGTALEIDKKHLLRALKPFGHIWEVFHKKCFHWLYNCRVDGNTVTQGGH